MHMRGVFLFAIIFVCCCVSAHAHEWNGVYLGRLAQDTWEQQLTFHASLSRSWLELNGGGFFVLSPEGYLFTPDWHLTVSFPGRFTMQWLKNRSHYSSQDLFGQLRSNNFSPETTALLVHSDWVRAGYLRHLPLRTGEEGDLWFYEGEFHTGPLLWRALQLQYVQTSGGGQAQSVEVLFSTDAVRTALAIGSHEWVGGAARAAAAQLDFERGPIYLDLHYQYVEPGYISLGAKSNRLTPDRTGWKGEVGVELPWFTASSEWRRQFNISGSRNYDRLVFGVAAPNKTVSLEFRLLPTKALAARYAKDGKLLQFDVINRTARFDSQVGSLMCGLRFDFARGIGRLELNGEVGSAFSWRGIVKNDWQNGRNYSSLLLRRQFGRASFQVELGEYDRGNMLSGFGTRPELSISWHWEF